MAKDIEIYRTKFKGDIIAEFAMPAKKSSDVIILCHGMPGVPKQKEVLQFLAKKGYWVFLPRYRGTWESGGSFLDHSPHDDILDVIDELPRGFTELWSDTHYTLNPKRLYIIGGSFGGPAAIFAARDPRVTKAVAFASVINWRIDGPDEPMDKLGSYIPEAFGEYVYRFTPENWAKLSRGEFYNPADEAATIPGKKLLMIHAKDDGSCLYPPAKEFAENVGAKLITLARGGHFGNNKILEPVIYKKVAVFLRA